MAGSVQYSTQTIAGGATANTDFTPRAGDVFRAAFIYGLVNGLPPREMLQFANAAAAISCTRAGAMPSVPALQEVRDALSGAS